MAGIPKLAGAYTHPLEADAKTLSKQSLRRLEPYNVARRLGWEEYRHTGALFLPELFIVGILASLRKPDGSRRAFYDDKDGLVRLRRNLLIVADRDSRKGSCVRLWRRIFDVKHYSTPDAVGGDCLVEATAQGGTRWEAITGGAQEGRLVPPSIIGCDLLVVEELMSWLGHNYQSMMNLVDQLNGAIQDGDVTKDLVKMKGSDDKTRNRFQDDCAALGVQFNPANCVMHFVFDLALVALSRQPDQKIWGGMLESGIIGRTAPCEWAPTEALARELEDDPFGPGDPEAMSFLQSFARLVIETPFEHVDYPPIDLVQVAYRKVRDEYRLIGDQTGVPTKRLKVGREHQYLAQLMTFNAVCRTVGPDAGSVERLEYVEEDALFAAGHFKHYVIPFVERRAMAGVKSVRDDALLDEAIECLKSFVKSRYAQREDPYHYQQFGGGEFYSHYTASKKVSNPTYQKRVVALVEAELLHALRERRNGRERVYAVDDRFMREELHMPTISDLQSQNLAAYEQVEA